MVFNANIHEEASQVGTGPGFAERSCKRFDLASRK
jgi:hypothetical protein